MPTRSEHLPVPATYTFDAATGVILVIATGEFSTADYLALQRAVEGDPTVPTGAAVLFDLRSVTTFAFSGHEIVGFARATDSVDRRAGRIAVVVSGPEGYSLARMYESARAPERQLFKIFGAIEPAMTWLVEQ
jgi:hypothetical protein